LLEGLAQNLETRRRFDGAAGLRDDVHQRLAQIDHLEQSAKCFRIDVVDEVDPRPSALAVREQVVVRVCGGPQQCFGAQRRTADADVNQIADLAGAPLRG
jgi:hypothetical protein